MSLLKNTSSGLSLVQFRELLGNRRINELPRCKELTNLPVVLAKDPHHGPPISGSESVLFLPLSFFTPGEYNLI